jgi:hypothetical protein
LRLPVLTLTLASVASKSFTSDGEAFSGGEDETCKILAQGFDLAWSRRQPEFFRDRWRHTIEA